MKHGIYFMAVSSQNEEIIEKLVDAQLTMLRGWWPEVTWFVQPIYGSPSKIEVFDGE